MNNTVFFINKWKAEPITKLQEKFLVPKLLVLENNTKLCKTEQNYQIV